MGKLLAFAGRLILGAASVLGIFVVVLVGLGVYLVSVPLRSRGLAPRYALSKAVVDALVAMNVLVSAAREVKAETDAAAAAPATPPHTPTD